MNTNLMNEYNYSQCDIGKDFSGVGEYKCQNCSIQSQKVDVAVQCLKCDNLEFVNRTGINVYFKY